MSLGDDSVAAKLHATTDAAVWATEFIAMYGGDWYLMLTWFANAIEVGRAAGPSPELPDA